MQTNNLILYQYPSCPFCNKVLRFLDANTISVAQKDTMLDPAARQELVALGGKAQVPALRIGDEILYESDDIIRWFQQNVVQAEALE